jgi:hypothetical protein
VAAIVAASEIESLSADQRGVEPGYSSQVEGAARHQPVGAIVAGVEVAVPDQKAVTDLVVLGPEREVQRVLAEPIGRRVPERQPA